MRAFCRTNSSSVFSLIWNINEVSGRRQAGRTLSNRSRASSAKVRLLRPHDSAWKIIMRWDVLPIIMNDYSPKWSWYLFTRTSRLKMNCKGYSEFEGQSKCIFNTIYSLYPDIFYLTGQSSQSGYGMGYMGNLFFVKRGIMIGSYRGPKRFFEGTCLNCVANKTLNWEEADL